MRTNATLATALLTGVIIAAVPLRPADLVAQTPAIAPVPHTYREVEGRALKAHVFSTDGAERRRPAVLLFHGGGWQIGEVGWVFDRARDFARQGLVAIAVEYRLSVDGKSPVDAVEDAVTAFTWVRQHAAELRLDVNRVAGYGVSAGGHLVATAATLPAVRGAPVARTARPNAMILVSPALNMGDDGYFMRLMKGHGDPHHYSPSAYVGRSLPPTLIIQGEADSIVFTRDARAFCDRATRSGARCELHVYPGVGHLLTRNLAVQYRDFDSDPAKMADARRREDAFVRSLRYATR
jgi:acetyl esterase